MYVCVLLVLNCSEFWSGFCAAGIILFVGQDSSEVVSFDFQFLYCI